MLGLSGKAEAVHPANGAVGIQIILDAAVSKPGDGALKLCVALKVRHGAAALDVPAAPGDAAHVARRGNVRARRAAAQRPGAETGDTPGVFVPGADAPGGAAEGNKAVVHPARNAPGAGFHCTYRGIVFASAYQREHLIASAVEDDGGDIELILAVKGDVQCNVSRDAPGVRIGADGGAVQAVHHGAARGIWVVQVGHIGYVQRVRGTAQAVEHLRHCSGDVRHSRSDALHIGCKRSAAGYPGKRVYYRYKLLEVCAELIQRVPVGRAVDDIDAVGYDADRVLHQVGGVRHSGVHAVEHIVHRGLELIQPRAQVRQSAAREVPLGVRLYLPDDAADVLASGDFAVVRAAGNAPALPPGNAADIVADVRIAHRAAVRAVLYERGAQPRDTSDVGNVDDVLLAADPERGDIKAAVLPGGDILGVDVHHAAAVTECPLVLARNAAHSVAAVERAGDRAAAYLCASGVEPRNAADGAHRLNVPVKAAAGYFSVIDTGDAADALPRPGRLYSTGDAEVFDLAALKDHAEQPLSRARGVETYADDAVPLPVKGAGEQRDRREVQPREVDVVFKKNRPALRPCVRDAVCSKLHEFIGSGYSDRVRIILRRERPCHKARQEQQHAQKHRKSFFHTVSPPPFSRKSSFLSLYPAAL